MLKPYWMTPEPLPVDQVGGSFGFTTGLADCSLPEAIFSNGWQDGGSVGNAGEQPRNRFVDW